jgi:phospholipid/cholesterol/gamma-HCH transport system substrate-binding protein
VNIPNNSIAYIDGPILGGTFINVAKGTTKTYLKSGDTISTRLDQDIFTDLKAQVTPTITRVNETLDSLKITIGSLNDVFDPNTRNNLRTMINNLTITSAHLQQLMNAQSGALAQSLQNMNSVSGNLARNNDAISSSIRNVEVTTSNLARANIEGTVATLQATIAEFQSTINRLNSSNGSIGLLMNDRQLYDRMNAITERMNTAALSAEILLDDIKVHPKRYVNFSLFGGRNKGEPLTSPLIKDSVPVRQ